METERKTLTQLSVPICLETLFYMLSGMVDTLMLSSVSDQAVGAVGTAIIPDDITPNMIIKTPIYVLAVPTAPTAWSLTDDSISVSTIPESI